MKLWWLKRQLKRRYIAYLNYRDQFSCGNSIAEHVSLTLVNLKDAVNETIRAIKAIDTTCQLKEL